MTDAVNLYNELKPEVQSLVGPLFEFAEQQVRKRGVFLPFGACLKRDGKRTLEAATSGAEMESTDEILPLLHDGLRASAAHGDVKAVAVCEWVKITLDGRKPTDAMKVLVEHEKGLTVAFYVPCRKRLIGGWTFDEMFVRPVEPEVRPWDGGFRETD